MKNQKKLLKMLLKNVEYKVEKETSIARHVN